MKQKGSISAIGVCVYYMLMLCALLGGFFLGSSAMEAYQGQVLRDDAAQIDKGLVLYAKTQEIPAYPSDLHDVAVARTQKYWMLTDVLRFLRHGNYEEGAEIKSRFRYTPILDAERHYTMYKLEVTLPNGQNYISPGSTYPKS